MSFFDRNQLDQVKADGLDDRMASNGLVPEGFHHAQLVGAKEVVAASGTVGVEMSFEVIKGPSKGLTVRDTLWTSDKGRDRAAIFACRLGLVTSEAGRLTPIDGKTDFVDCLDTECIIEVQHEEYDKKNGSGKGTSCRLSFNGVRRSDDPEAVALADGLPKPDKATAAAKAKSSATPAATKAKPNYADI